MVNTGPLGPVDPCGIELPPELTDDDRSWVRQHLELAGRTPIQPGPGKPPVDTSWLVMTKIRG